MNTKSFLNIFILFVVLLLAYFIYTFFEAKKVQIQNIQDNANLTETSMRVSENYIPEKWEDKGKTIWKGSGFEPGFYFEIKEGKENSYPAKFNFQNEGEMFGSFTLIKNENTIEYEGGLLLGGDGMISTKIKIENKKCFHASGEDTIFSVNLEFGDQKLNGCAEIVN
jgi:hypothetical protein